MIIDQLNEIWTGFLEFISRFLIPAWGELINMLPVLLADRRRRADRDPPDGLLVSVTRS